MILYLSAPNLEFVMILALHGHPNLQATASNGTWNYSNYVLQALIQAELGEQDVETWWYISGISDLPWMVIREQLSGSMIYFHL